MTNAFFCIFSFYEELLAQDILKPLIAPVEAMMLKEDEIVNYVTPHGVSSIVKHYLKESGRSFVFNYFCWFFSSGFASSLTDIHYYSKVWGHQVFLLFF